MDSNETTSKGENMTDKLQVIFMQHCPYCTTDPIHTHTKMVAGVGDSGELTICCGCGYKKKVTWKSEVSKPESADQLHLPIWKTPDSPADSPADISSEG